MRRRTARGYGPLTPGPRLAALIEQGHAYIEDGAVVGVAADGVEVSLGVAHEDQQARIEMYLADFPGPEQW